MAALTAEPAWSARLERFELVHTRRGDVQVWHAIALKMRLMTRFPPPGRSPPTTPSVYADHFRGYRVWGSRALGGGEKKPAVLAGLKGRG